MPRRAPLYLTGTDSIGRAVKYALHYAGTEWDLELQLQLPLLTCPRRPPGLGPTCLGCGGRADRRAPYYLLLVLSSNGDGK